LSSPPSVEELQLELMSNESAAAPRQAAREEREERDEREWRERRGRADMEWYREELLFGAVSSRKLVRFLSRRNLRL
jgi:hypothetical protein